MSGTLSALAVAVVALVVGCAAPAPAPPPVRPGKTVTEVVRVTPGVVRITPLLAVDDHILGMRPTGCDGLLARPSVSRAKTGRAVFFLIDRSGSMRGPNLEAAKDVVREALTRIESDALIRVVAFDTAPKLIVPVQRAANYVRAVAAISQITAGGETNLCPALEKTWELLRKVEVADKEIVIVTDGVHPEYPALPAPGIDKRVTVIVFGPRSDAPLRNLASIDAFSWRRGQFGSPGALFDWDPNPTLP